jgi:hypothetical protein
LLLTPTPITDYLIIWPDLDPKHFLAGMDPDLAKYHGTVYLD